MPCARNVRDSHLEPPRPEVTDNQAPVACRVRCADGCVARHAVPHAVGVQTPEQRRSEFRWALSTSRVGA